MGFSADKNLRSFEATKWDNANKPLRDSMLRTIFDNALFHTFITRDRKGLQYPSSKRIATQTDAHNYDYIPVGYVGKDIQKQTDIDTGLIYISGATAGKQKINHPDLKSTDYTIIQEILDKGSIVGNTANTGTFIGYIEKDGKYYKAVWKTIAPHRDELWLMSLTKSQPEQYKLRKNEYWIRK